MDSDRKKDRSDVRDVVINLDDAQIKEVLVDINRQDAPILYANLSKFSRLGVDFVLDLVQIDPAEFNLLIEGARKRQHDEHRPLHLDGKIVARVLMGPIMVKNLREQADTIMQGVEVQQPKTTQGMGTTVDTATKKVIAS